MIRKNILDKQNTFLLYQKMYEKSNFKEEILC